MADPRLHVRDATEADLPSAARWMKETQDAHVAAYPHRYRPMSLEAVEDQLSKDFESGCGFVIAWLDETPIGYAVFETVETPGGPVLMPRRHVYLRQIGVDASARGLGAGRLLIEHVRQECARQGIDQLELDVWAFNAKARAFFERAGFEHFATKMRCSTSDA